MGSDIIKLKESSSFCFDLFKMFGFANFVGLTVSEIKIKTYIV